MLVDAIYKDPKYWGPHYWFVMKCIAENYPVKPSSSEKDRARIFYNNLKYFVPCETCRKHYTELIARYPVEEKLCCTDCLKGWVSKIQLKIEDIKKGKYNDNETSYNDKRHKSKGKSYHDNKSKRFDSKSRAKSGKRNKDNYKSKNFKYDADHDSGNNKYFKATPPTFVNARAAIPNVVASPTANAYISKRNINFANGASKFAMNNKANNINAVQNQNPKFNHQKAINFGPHANITTGTHGRKR